MEKPVVNEIKNNVHYSSSATTQNELQNENENFLNRETKNSKCLSSDKNTAHKNSLLYLEVNDTEINKLKVTKRFNVSAAPDGGWGWMVLIGCIYITVS